MLADVGLTLVETAAALRSNVNEVVPTSEPRQNVNRKRGALLGIQWQEMPEYDENDQHHRQRVQQRPAETKHRPLVACAQVDFDQGCPEIPATPYGAEVGQHASLLLCSRSAGT